MSQVTLLQISSSHMVGWRICKSLNVIVKMKSINRLASYKNYCPLRKSDNMSKILIADLFSNKMMHLRNKSSY